MRGKMDSRTVILSLLGDPLDRPLDRHPSGGDCDFLAATDLLRNEGGRRVHVRSASFVCTAGSTDSVITSFGSVLLPYVSQPAIRVPLVVAKKAGSAIYGLPRTCTVVVVLLSAGFTVALRLVPWGAIPRWIKLATARAGDRVWFWFALADPDGRSYWSSYHPQRESTCTDRPRRTRLAATG
jgi:hypothetical protein